MYFTGRHRNGVDAKGRVSVPAPLRACLEGAEGVYLFPSQHRPCLEGAGASFMEGRAALLEKLDPLDPKRAALERLYFGLAVFCAFDSAGRVTLPAHLREQFEIAEDAVFVGMRDRFELWAPAREEAWDRQSREIAAGVTSLRDLTGAST
jgi:MraZ protein